MELIENTLILIHKRYSLMKELTKMLLSLQKGSLMENKKCISYASENRGLHEDIIRAFCTENRTLFKFLAEIVDKKIPKWKYNGWRQFKLNNP